MKNIIWIYGQPGHGKTTIALEVVKKLSEAYKVMHIDGDDLRDLTKNTSYSPVGRKVNIMNAQFLTKFLVRKHYIVVVSMVTPYKTMREFFAQNHNPLMVYVHTTDLRGREDYHVKEFEQSYDDLSIDTGVIDVQEATRIIMKSIFSSEPSTPLDQ